MSHISRKVILSHMSTMLYPDITWPVLFHSARMSVGGAVTPVSYTLHKHTEDGLEGRLAV